VHACRLWLSLSTYALWIQHSRNSMVLHFCSECFQSAAVCTYTICDIFFSSHTFPEENISLAEQKCMEADDEAECAIIVALMGWWRLALSGCHASSSSSLYRRKIQRVNERKRRINSWRESAGVHTGLSVMNGRGMDGYSYRGCWLVLWRHCSRAADERGLRCGLVAFVKSRLRARHAMKIDVIETVAGRTRIVLGLYYWSCHQRKTNFKLAS